MLTVAWSFYVEFYGLQPWREYQSRFARAYSTLSCESSQRRKKKRRRGVLLRRIQSSASKSRRRGKVRQSPRRPNRQANRAPRRPARRPRRRLQRRPRQNRLARLSIRNRPGLRQDTKAARKKDLEDAATRTGTIWKVDWPIGDGKIQKNKPFTGDELNDIFTGIIAQRAALVGQARRNRQARERSPRRAKRNTPPSIFPASAPRRSNSCSTPCAISTSASFRST